MIKLTEIHTLFVLLSVCVGSLRAVAQPADVTKGPVQNLGLGQFQAHYTASCDAVIFICVGTAMSVTEYEELGKSVARQDPLAVAVIIDSDRGSIQKQNGKKFTDLVNAISEDISNLVDSCSETKPQHYLIGGHSGGGQGAVEALKINQLVFAPAGFVGLAPYKITPDLKISIPSLNIGFSKMSCAVSPNEAALAAYSNSDSSNRVFYQLQTNNFNVVTGGPHCSFADNGCALGMCSGKGNISEWMHDFVGQTVHLFLEAIRVPDKFDYNQFLSAITTTGPREVDLFVNSDVAVMTKRGAIKAAPVAPR